MWEVPGQGPCPVNSPTHRGRPEAGLGLASRWESPTSRSLPWPLGSNRWMGNGEPGCVAAGVGIGEQLKCINLFLPSLDPQAPIVADGEQRMGVGDGGCGHEAKATFLMVIPHKVGDPSTWFLCLCDMFPSKPPPRQLSHTQRATSGGGGTHMCVGTADFLVPPPDVRFSLRDGEQGGWRKGGGASC